MLNAKQREQVKTDVQAAYKEKYPSWSDVRITEIVENVYFGTMVAVKSSEFPDGEICLHTKHGVVIFDTTPELVRYLDMKASHVISLRDWLTAIVVLVTLGLFAAVVFVFKQPEAVSLVVTAMAGILGTYAGVHLKSSSNDAA
jgi:hypothetical protein